MNKVTSYLKNVGKSIGYATVDVSINMIPDVKDFIETNEDVFKAVYATVAHSKKSIQLGKKVINDSQIYKDIDTGIKNVLSDIKTGNWYNKTRSDAAIDSAAESMAGGFEDFDDDDFNFDDFDNFDDDSDSNDSSSEMSISKGDLVIADSVSKSGNLSAQLISKTVASTSNAIMKTNVATANVMMAQNVELMAGLRTGIAGVHQSINSVLQFATDQVVTQFQNETKYFETTTALMQENNAILKEMLEMQRNMYKAQDGSESSDQFGNIFSGGSLDIKEYLKVVKKNFFNLDPTGTLDMLLNTNVGGGSMLGQMFANPLGSLLTGLVRGFMPKEAVKSIMSFSKTLGNIIPTMLARLNNWKDDDSKGIFHWLGKLFGVKTDTKKSIDTSKYNKGAVPFDGITRKAIIEVIPDHLARIESLLSGKSQRIYDYHSGKWTTAKDLEKKKEDEYNNNIKDSFSELSDDIKTFINYMKDKKSLSYDDVKSLEEDIFKMMKDTYENHNGWFAPEDIIKNRYIGFNNEDIMNELLTSLTKVPLYKLSSVARNTAENKKKYADTMRNAEINGDSVYNGLFNEAKYDSHIIYDKKFKNQEVGSRLGFGILNARDSSFVPEELQKLKKDEDDKRKSYNKYYYDTNVKAEDIASDAAYKTKISSTDLDEDEVNKYGKYYKDKNKYMKGMEDIPGNTFIEKFRNAKSMKAKYTLIMGSLSDIARKPAAILTGLIDKADHAIYNMLFKAETDEFDEDGNKIKGLFNAMLDKMRAGWTVLTETLKEKVIDPLAKKLGLGDKWDKLKDKFSESSIGQRFINFKDNLKSSLKSNTRSIWNYGKSAVNDTIVKPVLYSEHVANSIIDSKTKKLNKVDESINQIDKEINSLDRVGRANISLSTLKEIAKLKNPDIKGFATGGTHKDTGNPKITVTSEGEDVKVVNHNDSEKTAKNAEIEQRIIDKLNKAFYSKNKLTKQISNLKENKQYNALDWMVDATVEELKKDYNAIKDTLGIKRDEESSNKKSNTEDSQNKIKETVVNIIKEMGGHGADTLAKGIIGGGIGLLSGVVGGPLIGAAIGSGYSLIKNSTTVSKALFGEQTIDEKTGLITEQKGGLINKDIQNTFKKYIPDMGKFGVAGIVSSLILPFGPLTGAAIGAGISLTKNSETLNTMIFGEQYKDQEGNNRRKGGLLSEERIKKIKEYFPKASVGAIAGMLTGPFGLLGNAALGAGIGMLTGTEEFQELILGKDDGTGERFGGLKGALEEHFINPIKDFSLDFKDNFFEMLKVNMIDPLNEAITPLTHEIAYFTKKAAFAIPKFLAKIFEDKVGAPLMAVINDKLIDPVLGFTKGIFKTASKAAQNILFAPFKGARALSRRARARQIKRGDANYMGAEEQLQFMTEMGYDDYGTKQQLQSMVGMSNEQINQAMTLVQGSVEGLDFIDSKINRNNRKLGNLISKNFKEGKIGGGAAGKIRKAINNGDLNTASELLYDLKNRGKISAEDFDNYAKQINQLAASNQKLKLQKQNLNKFLNDKGEIDESSAIAELNKYGFNISNKKDLKRLLKNLQGENKYRSNKNIGDLTSKAMRESLTDDGQAITGWLEKIYNTITGVKESAEKGGTVGLTENQKSTVISQELLARTTQKEKSKAISDKVNQRAKSLQALGISGRVFSEAVLNAISDDTIYKIILNCAKNNTILNKEQIINLTKLNKTELENLSKKPTLASLDLKSMKRYLGENAFAVFGLSTRKNRNLLEKGINAGLDLSSLDSASELLSSGKNKNSIETRIQYVNKFREIGLLGKYGLTQPYILKANFKDLDMILKDPKSYVKKYADEQKIEVSDEELDNMHGTSINSSGGILQKVKTIFTENGIMRYIRNNRGEYKPDKSNAETKETLKQQKLESNKNTGLVGTLTSIKDGLLGWFKRSKEKEEENKKEPWYKKLFNFDLSSIGSGLKFGGAILAGFTAIGALKKLWDNREPGGVIDTIGSSVGNFVNPIITKVHDWFANEGQYESEDKGLQGLINKQLLPNLFGGIDFVIGKVLPKITESLIVALPTIISAALSGFKRIIGLGNNHENDNTGTDADFGTSTTTSGTLAWKNANVYAKDNNGELVPIADTADKSTLNEFYTESGVKYYRNEDGKFVSEKGDTSKEQSLSSRVAGAWSQSFLRGRKMPKVISGAGEALSKIPGLKTFGKVMTPIGKGIEGVVNSGSSLNNFIQDLGTAPGEKISQRLANTDFGKTIVQKTKTITEKVSNNSVVKFVKNSLEGIINAIKGKFFKEGLEKAGKEATQEAIEKASKGLLKTLMEKFTGILSKVGSKIAIKFSEKAASFLMSGGLINIGLAVADFIKGFDQAKAILGIDEVSFVQRLLAGLVNAVNNFVLLGLIDTSVIVDWLAGPVLSLFGMDPEAFEQQQAEADAIVEQYNIENGTNISKEEYYKNQTITGKIGNFFGGIGNNIKSGFNTAKNWAGDKLSSAWSSAKEIGGNIWSSAKSVGSKAVSAVGSAVKPAIDAVGQKIGNTVELAKYAATVTKDVFRDIINGKNVETEGVEVDENDPLYNEKRTVFQVVKILGLIPGGIVHVVKGTGDIIKSIIKGAGSIGSSVVRTTGDFFVKSWQGKIGEAILDNSHDANTGIRLVDSLSQITNGLTKTVILVPGLITSLLGAGYNLLKPVFSGIATVGSGMGNTVTNLFSKAWNGKFYEAFADKSFDANTGNGLVDGASFIANSATKTVMIIPGLITSVAGYVKRNIGAVIDGITTVGSGVGNTVTNLFSKAWNGQFYEAFEDKSFDANTGNGLVDGASFIANSATKTVMIIPGLITSAVGAVSRNFDKLTSGFGKLSTAIESDDSIIDKAKSGDITPFSPEYWKFDAIKEDGVTGWLYKIGSMIKRVANLPAALLGMLNPVNWFDNVTDEFAKFFKIDMKEYNGSEADYANGEYTSGRGSGFVSQLDPRYKNQKFNTAGDTQMQTIGDSGCAPATAANILNLYAGKGTGMQEAARFALNYKDKNGGVTPDYFSDYLGKNGISTYSTDNKQEMLQSIRSGQPTILLGADPSNMANTPYGSSSSHYVLATGMDGKGNVIVQDPESRRPNSIYPARDLLNQSIYGMVTGRGSGKGINKLRTKLGSLGFGRGSKARYQDLGVWSELTADEINEFIRKKAGNNRGFSGKGEYFVKAAQASGLDPRYILAHSAVETGWGDSKYAKAGNMFGIGAFDSNPDNALNYGNSSMETGLIEGAKWIRKNYYDKGQKTLYTMRHNNGKHEYATDPNWDTKIASIMDKMPTNTNATYHTPNNTITSGVTDSSSGMNSLFSMMESLPEAYFGKELMSLFGFNSSSSNSTTASTLGGLTPASNNKVENATRQMEIWANDPNVGYDQTYRWGQKGDYDCSAAVISAYQKAGIPVKTNGASYTGNMLSTFKRSGFTDITRNINLSTGDGLQRGDVLLNSGKHTAIYTGDGKEVEASINEKGTSKGGKPGDQTGKEFLIRNYRNYPWTSVLRYSGSGSGKNKQSRLLHNLYSMTGRGTTSIPSLDNNYNNTLKTNQYTSLTSTSQLPTLESIDREMSSINLSSNTGSNTEKLLAVIIDILRIIAGNSEKLSEIVTLLSKALDLNLSNEDISKLSSNNTQIKNKIANALKSQGSSSGMGSSIMNSSTESLAQAMYSIARA